jgi:hypothetical protein
MVKTLKRRHCEFHHMRALLLLLALSLFPIPQTAFGIDAEKTYPPICIDDESSACGPHHYNTQQNRAVGADESLRLGVIGQKSGVPEEDKEIQKEIKRANDLAETQAKSNVKLSKDDVVLLREIAKVEKLNKYVNGLLKVGVISQLLLAETSLEGQVEFTLNLAQMDLTGLSAATQTFNYIVACTILDKIDNRIDDSPASIGFWEKLRLLYDGACSKH